MEQKVNFLLPPLTKEQFDLLQECIEIAIGHAYEWGGDEKPMEALRDYLTSRAIEVQGEVYRIEVYALKIGDPHA